MRPGSPTTISLPGLFDDLKEAVVCLELAGEDLRHAVGRCPGPEFRARVEDDIAKALCYATGVTAMLERAAA